MGIVNLGRYLTPTNISMVQGLIDEFSRSPVLVDLVKRFEGKDTTQAYVELTCLSDRELMAVAQAIGKINGKVAKK